MQPYSLEHFEDFINSNSLFNELNSGTTLVKGIKTYGPTNNKTYRVHKKINVFTNTKIFDIILKKYFGIESITTLEQINSLAKLSIDLFDKENERVIYKNDYDFKFEIMFLKNSINLTIQNNFFHICIEKDVKDTVISLFYDINELTEDFSQLMTSSDTLDDLYNNHLEDINYKIRNELNICKSIELNKDHLSLIKMLKI